MVSNLGREIRDMEPGTYYVMTGRGGRSIFDRYRAEKALTCWNLYREKDHIANIFQHGDGRWYVHDAGWGTGRITCRTEGYGTRLSAMVDAARQYEEATAV